MATLKQYFETEFPYAFTVKKQMQAHLENNIIQFDVIVHLDFDAFASYVSIYLSQELQYISPIIEGIIKNPFQVPILNGVFVVDPPKVVPAFTKV